MTKEVLISYNPNIPLPTDLISDSQAQIKTNFGTANTSFGIDHYSFDNATANNGKHKFVHLVTQAANPALAATDGALFSKIVGSNTELFYRYGSAPQNTFQVTNNGAVANTNGVSSLISPEAKPMKIQWGQETSSGTANPNTTVTFPAAYINPAYSVVCTVLTTDNNRYFVQVYNITNTGFTATIRDSSGTPITNKTFCWMATGN